MKIKISRNPGILVALLQRIVLKHEQDAQNGESILSSIGMDDYVKLATEVESLHKKALKHRALAEIFTEDRNRLLGIKTGQNISNSTTVINAVRRVKNILLGHFPQSNKQLIAWGFDVNETKAVSSFDTIEETNDVIKLDPPDAASSDAA